MKNIEKKNSQSPERNNGQEDDAMFQKKPLGGWSCASCEKGLNHQYPKKS
jgi:hypothetical protein